MAIVTTDNQHYAAIASAIREKNGETAQYLPAQMAAAIAALETGGGDMVTMTTGTISANNVNIETGLSSVQWFVIWTKSRSSGQGRLKMAIVDSTGKADYSYFSNMTTGTTVVNATNLFSISGGTVTHLKPSTGYIADSMTWIAIGQG